VRSSPDLFGPEEAVDAEASREAMAAAAAGERGVRDE
jgi:hypothetical protein